MNPRLIVLSAAGLALTVASCQRQKAPTFTEADRTAVRALFDSTVARVNTKNFTAWANQFTEDAPFMPPNHPIVRGRANLKAWADSLPPLTGFSFGDVTVNGEGDMAVGTSSYAMTFHAPGAPSTADKGKQLVTFHRQADGSWLVTAGAFSSDLPLPSAGPPPRAAVKK